MVVNISIPREVNELWFCCFLLINLTQQKACRRDARKERIQSRSEAGCALNLSRNHYTMPWAPLSLLHLLLHLATDCFSRLSSCYLADVSAKLHADMLCHSIRLKWILINSLSIAYTLRRWHWGRHSASWVYQNQARKSFWKTFSNAHTKGNRLTHDLYPGLTRWDQTLMRGHPPKNKSMTYNVWSYLSTNFN